MKATYWLALFLTLAVGHPAQSQSATPTKIYFSGGGGKYFILELKTTLSPNAPIRINNCTLLETNADSIGLNLSRDKNRERIVYVRFEPGKTYYYQVTARYGGGVGLAVLACTEQEFWLSTYFSGVGTYRHYFVDKATGLRLLEEDKR